MSSTALPVGPMPVASPPAARGGSSDSAATSAQAGEEFLALVQQLLLGGPTIPVAAEESTEEGTSDDGAAEAAANGEAAALLGAAAPWAPVPPGLALMVPAGQGSDTAANLTVEATPAGAAGASTGVTTPVGGIPGGSRPGADGQPLPQGPQPGSQPGTGSETPSVSGGATAPAETTGALDLPVAAAPATTSAAGAAALAATGSEASPSTAGVGATGQATPTSPTATVAGTGQPAPVRVVEQVFPEVIRLAGNGNGMQRLTLRLQPENLGEVRVVLISRPGEQLVISLAAGVEAQESLLNGSSELRRLLDTIGNGDARIVVRDLASGSPNVGQTAAGQQGQQGQQPGSDGTATDLGADSSAPGSGDPQGEPTTSQHAGTRGNSSATDGTDGAATSPHRVDPVTGARTAGIDVTV